MNNGKTCKMVFGYDFCIYIHVLSQMLLYVAKLNRFSF